MCFSLALQDRSSILHRTLVKLLEIKVDTETGIDIPQPAGRRRSNSMHVHNIPGSRKDAWCSTCQVEIERRVGHLELLEKSSIIGVLLP